MPGVRRAVLECKRHKMTYVAVSIGQDTSKLDDGGSFFFGFMDGYYAFLHPLFKELAENTGEMIDLWDDAIFKGNDLVELRNTVDAALALVKGQPPEFEVLSAWSPQYDERGQFSWKEEYTEVSRDEFISLLDNFKELVNHAIEKGEYVVCLGD